MKKLGNKSILLTYMQNASIVLFTKQQIENLIENCLRLTNPNQTFNTTHNHDP